MTTPSGLYREVTTSTGITFMIDAEDFYRVMEYKWRGTTHKSAGPYLRSATRGSHATRRQILLHRFVLGLPDGDGSQVDHINGNTLDNRKANLRIVSGLQNMWNCKMSVNNKTGMKSIHWDESKKRWRVAIYKEGKRFGGYFKYFVDAAQASVFIRALIHGEYARFE